MFGQEVLHQVDVFLPGRVAVGALEALPGIVLGRALEVEHAGLVTMHIAFGRLLVERVEVQQVLVGGAGGQVFDALGGGLEILFEAHGAWIGRIGDAPPGLGVKMGRICPEINAAAYFCAMQLNFKSFGSGPALIILHGLFGSLDNWQTLAKQYAAHFSVFIVDQRNHGKSPREDSAFTYAALAEDLREFMDQQGMYAAHLIGHSMGGKVVMQFAAEHEGMVERMVVADMGIRAYPPHHEDVLPALREFPFGEITRRQDADEWLAERIKDFGTRQFILKNLDRDADNRFEWKFNFPVLDRDYTNILAGVDASFPIHTPTLFLNGANSNYVRVEDRPAIQSIFPDAEFQTIADAGHWLHADKPAEFYAATVEFLLRK